MNQNCHHEQNVLTVVEFILDQSLDSILKKTFEVGEYFQQSCELFHKKSKNACPCVFKAMEKLPITVVLEKLFDKCYK